MLKDGVRKKAFINLIMPLVFSLNNTDANDLDFLSTHIQNV